MQTGILEEFPPGGKYDVFTEGMRQIHLMR